MSESTQFSQLNAPIVGDNAPTYNVGRYMRYPGVSPVFHRHILENNCDPEEWWIESKKTKQPTLLPPALVARFIYGASENQSRGMRHHLAYRAANDSNDFRSSGGLFILENGVWHEWTTVKRDLHLVIQAEKLTVSDVQLKSIMNDLRGMVEPFGEPRRGVIPFRNGLLDITSNTFRTYHRSDWIYATSPLDYIPSAAAKCPTFERWLVEVCQEDDDKIMVVLACMYMAMAGMGKWRKFVEVTGPTGSGKSTLARLLIALVGGTEYVKATSMDALATDRFVFADIEGKRLILMNDQDAGLYPSGKLKQLTGGDALEIRQMHKANCRPYINTAPVFMFNNAPMRFKDYSSAMDDRRVIIRFGRSLKEDQKDYDLDSKLEAELPAIINKLLNRFPDADWARQEIAGWQASSLESRDVKADADPLYDFARSLQLVDLVLSWDGNTRDGIDHAVLLADLMDGWNRYRMQEDIEGRSIPKKAFANELFKHLRDIHQDRELPDVVFEKFEGRSHGSAPVRRLWWSLPEHLTANPGNDYDD